MRYTYGIAGNPRLGGGVHCALSWLLSSLEPNEEIDFRRFAHWSDDESFMFDACDPGHSAAELFERNFDAPLAVGALGPAQNLGSDAHIHAQAIATYRLLSARARP